MMKKLISLLCVLSIVIAVIAVSAVAANGAVDAAKTKVDVKKGQDVSYVLKLSGVELPIVGCDFSVYFDSDLLKVDSVADFNDQTDDNEWVPMINPDLNGEVRGNWSILNGVKFKDQRNFITVNFKALADGETDISYFIRYMYDNNIFNSDDKPQITEYLFTCDVSVDGEPVIEEAQPELNLEEPQTNGLFVNSVTGDSKDADPELPGAVVTKNAGNSGSGQSAGSAVDNEVAPDHNGGGNSNVGGGNADKTAADNKEAAAASSAPLATTSEGYFITATDADGNVTATADEALFDAPVTTTGNKGGASPVIWIVIAVVVLAACGAGAYFYMKKKKAAAPSSDSPVDAAPSDIAPTEEAPAEEAPAEEAPAEEAPAEEALADTPENNE